MSSHQSVLRPSSATRVAVIAAITTASALHASLVMEVDVDGADDGVVTYNPGFAFGGDTTLASQSLASGAFGLSGGDSIFGGNGVNDPDTYVFTYNPGLTPDNLITPAGTDLGGGNLATGVLGGNPGFYAVYATWPFTTNVSGGDTLFSVLSDDDSFLFSIDQNNKGDEWCKLGEIFWTSGDITVTQSSQSNTFVSTRSAGILFEAVGGQLAVPEPSAMVFAGLPVLLGLLFVRRRRS